MKKDVLIWLGVFLLFIPFLAMGARNRFYYAGWLPFWQKQEGAFDTAIHLDRIKEVSPFSFEVNSTGTLKDRLKINDGFWPGWISAVHDMGIKVMPTVAWFDGEGIHKLLTNRTLRLRHEDTIAKLVADKKFDGIDIDYESKKAETKDYFSLFIKGLAIRLHPKKKILSCTIESRTPLDSLRGNLPDDVPRANDYAVLNRYCDEVRIMTYDQGTIDVKLNAEKGNGAFYAPVADPDWMEKVIKLAIKSISRKKIMLGIPTYGYEYQATWSGGQTAYRRLRSRSYFSAMDLAEALNMVPERNSAGELGFAYVTSTFIEVPAILRSYVTSTLPALLAPSGTASSSAIAEFVSFPDAESMAAEIKLAKKYGLRGAAIFKLDGEADPMSWEVMR